MAEVKYMLEITMETREPEHKYIKRSFPIDKAGQRIDIGKYGYPYSQFGAVHATDFDEKEGRVRLEIDRRGATVSLNSFATLKWDNGYMNSNMYHVPGDKEIYITYYLYID